MHSSCSPRDCHRKKYCVLSLQTVLAARELRWKKKRLLAESLAQEFPGHRLAYAFCTLRMPASLRVSSNYKEIVVQLRDVFARALMDRAIPIIASGQEQYDDGPSAWLASDCDERILKQMAIAIEEGHALGALVDIDVTDAKARLLSRRDMGYAPRKCLVCDDEAALCSAGQRHLLCEIEAQIEEIISGSMGREAWDSYDGHKECD
ncbi:MAG: Apo-citrate lyase phosphoribosyl-dephospho-CoA transferase [Spirochaetes bacterium ADurb.Bin110]|nr:MAG: Apo-citrate lyase phosphoribosyl-dephospho-CoA transferase [Spirochaetes bacterium ADurb.Bin110]